MTDDSNKNLQRITRLSQFEMVDREVEVLSNKICNINLFLNPDSSILNNFFLNFTYLLN
jgi:hypothetical protein